MKWNSSVFAALAFTFVSCGNESEKTQSDYHPIYDRAVVLTKSALKFPEAASFPPFDSVTFSTRSQDTVSINFDVLAANAMGVKSKAETRLTFKLDSCAHLISGWVVNDVFLDPDPAGRPCSPTAIAAWELERIARATEEQRVQRDAVIAQTVEDSARFGTAAIAGKKVSGTHKYGGKTKVSWTPLAGLLDEARKNAKKNMESNSELQATLSAYYSASRGGRIRLDIERGTIGEVKFDGFTIVLQDSTGAEVYRGNFENDDPQYSSGKWWQIGMMNLPTYVRPPFSIFVIDALQDEPFKFLISAHR